MFRLKYLNVNESSSVTMEHIGSSVNSNNMWWKAHSHTLCCYCISFPPHFHEFNAVAAIHSKLQKNLLNHFVHILWYYIFHIHSRYSCEFLLSSFLLFSWCIQQSNFIEWTNDSTEHNRIHFLHCASLMPLLPGLHTIDAAIEKWKTFNISWILLLTLPVVLCIKWIKWRMPQFQPEHTGGKRMGSSELCARIRKSRSFEYASARAMKSP